MENRFEPCSLASVMDTDATLITVNQRLASALVEAADKHQLEAGKQCWSTLDCLPYQASLLRCWSGRLEQGVTGAEAEKKLLNAEQLQWVWRQIISEHSVGPLLNIQATAQMVAKAWDSYNAWSLSWSPSVSENSPDVAAFDRWKKAFLARSRAENWIDSARLPTVLASWYETDVMAVPSHIVLAGFDQMTPQQQHLFLVMQQAGCSIQSLQSDSRRSHVTRVRSSDEADELNQAAHWARSQVESTPDVRVAVVIPDLQSRRDEVERVFRRTCYPAALFQSQMPESLVYNLSYGRPLDQYPLVSTALTALKCLTGKRKLDLFSQLLNSRFLIAGDREWTQRALLESSLRQYGMLSLSWGQLANRIRQQQQDSPDFCGQLLAAMEALQSEFDSWSPRQLPDEWANLFTRALSLLGWPGERALDSTEYQTSQRWLEFLKDFAALGEVSGPLRLDEALSELSARARRCVFQPKTEAAPIQVMGVLESAGQSFDALWVAGLSHQAWPQLTRPNPYLPYTVQRQQHMPDASPEAQLAFAQRYFHHWSNAADEVVFSWPAQVDSCDMQPSALLSDIPERDSAGTEHSCSQTYEQRLFESAALESFRDPQGPPIDSGSVVRGGVAIIRDQSACPFRAFANHRLHTEVLEEPAPGLDARSRGSLVHQCLEALWGKLQTQAALLALSAAQRQDLVQETVQASLQEAAVFNPQLSGTFMELEHQRLCQILLDWLDVDGQREPFQVEQLEQRQTLEIAGLSIHTVIDRMDRLENGSLAIIDYKTGDCRVNDWFGERPKDPQLPLYGSQQGAEVSALAFAQLKTGKLNYLGVRDEDEPFSMLKPLGKVRHEDVSADWSEQMQSWSTSLESLAKAFAHGEAQVDPRPDACRYCQLDALCRVGQSGDEEVADV